MSQDYHHPNPNIYAAFSNEFEGRPSETNPTSTTTTVDPTYDTAAGGMLSEMFNFGPTHPATSANNNIIIDSPHHHHQWPPPYGAAANNNNNSAAAAMQLFLTHAPPPPPPSEIQGGFYSSVWGGGGGELSGINNEGGGQGLLSLSLSSSLAAKQAEDNQINQINQIMFFNQHQHQHQHQHQSATNTNTDTNTTTANNNSSSGNNNNDFFKNLSGTNPMTLHNMDPVGGFVGPSTSSVGFGSGSTSAAMGVVNVLRNSKYAKPAQELLEEFCSVGRGSSHQLKKPKLLLGSRQNSSSNTNPSTSGGGGGSGGGSSSKEGPQLAPSERIEHQRRKVKLLAMLDEVDKRYNNYCSQMQMVVNSFDLVMGYGGAIPYTALAQKAMSRHFRCLKDAIHTQLKHSCERLGEKDPTATSGLTKGETPRLKMLEQSLRQQRAFHQMGMMDQDAWRPQRGLPDRSVNILRAWLFEHFLHPYPSDADKHLLARQTGLSRNQVSNWFINARVRLWKPMVEEMYQQESKDDEDEDEENDDENMNSPTQTSNNNSFPTTQPQPQPQPQQLQVVAQNPIHRRHQHPASVSGLPSVVDDGDGDGDDDPHNVGPTTMISFGGPTGDVSLTLGLRHAGDNNNNAHDKSVTPFELIRDFGSC